MVNFSVSSSVQEYKLGHMYNLTITTVALSSSHECIVHGWEIMQVTDTCVYGTFLGEVIHFHLPLRLEVYDLEGLSPIIEDMALPEEWLFVPRR